MPPLTVIQLTNTPIFEQLQLEESIIRTQTGNWLILNTGSPPAIVFGISGKPEQHLAITPPPLPVIRRFSGGGTVVIDSDTLFVTWIFDKASHPVTPYPEPIMRWTGDFYTSALSIPHFHLKENDYAIGDKKCGGNAQFIRKDRWLHHTSFLWDYNPSLMALLKHPPKSPTYRQNRPHSDFLVPLHPHLPSKKAFFDSILQEASLHFRLEGGTRPPQPPGQRASGPLQTRYLFS